LILQEKTVEDLEMTEDEQYRALLRNFDASKFLSRGTASYILSEVAACGEYGGVCEFVTPEMVGAAVRRLVSNYTEDHMWLPLFLRGLSA
jgi:hypothetical protein